MRRCQRLFPILDRSSVPAALMKGPVAQTAAAIRWQRDGDQLRAGCHRERSRERKADRWELTVMVCEVCVLPSVVAPARPSVTPHTAATAARRTQQAASRRAASPIQGASRGLEGRPFSPLPSSTTAHHPAPGLTPFRPQNAARFHFSRLRLHPDVHTRTSSSRLQSSQPSAVSRVSSVRAGV